MAEDSLVSFVFALNANPKITIFLHVKVPNSFFTINCEILFWCQLFKSTTAFQNLATSGSPK